MEIPIQRLTDWGMFIKDKLFIAGPCSVESYEQLMKTAVALGEHKVNILRAGIWKPRSRPGSFEGVGMKGLEWLKNVSKVVKLPVAVEVAQPDHVEACLKQGIDVLWIGARTTSNPFSLQALADSLRGVDIPVMVKNPISPDIFLWLGAIERLHRAGIKKIAAIHRGFSSAETKLYRNKPEWRIPIELKRQIPDMPLICDPSHICGKKELLFSVSQEAMDLLYDGLMIEVHINPGQALSDREQQITPGEYGVLLKHLKQKKISNNSPDFQQNIKLLRQEIDEVDNHIIELLARRMAIVRKISVCKRKNDISLFQPERWNEIVKSRIKAGTDKKLSEDFMFQVYQSIHEEAIRHQEEEEH